jgi:hypothetical protein
VEESWSEANLRIKSLALWTCPLAGDGLGQQQLCQEMWSLEKSSLAEEMSRKLISMRRQDKSLSGIAITVQISTASILKTTAYEKHALVVMVVEQAKTKLKFVRLLSSTVTWQKNLQT